MTFELFALLIIFALGIVIGYVLGAARVNWPIIKWFRNHYRQCAQERIRQHTRFLIAQINIFGAVAVSHRSAETRASEGGRAGSRLSLLSTKSQHEGGDARGTLTTTNQPRFVTSRPSTGAQQLPIERP